MGLQIARASESEPYYAEITVERDKAIHYGFSDTITAQKWASGVARRMVNYQRHLGVVTGIPHEFVMPERCFTEEA